MNSSLTRNLPYWLLIALSLISTAIGAWLIAGQIGTMTTTLLDGTATGIEVYVGQSMVVVGAALLGAGVLGILLALVLSAATSLLRTPSPVDTASELPPTSAGDDVDGETSADAANDAAELSDAADAETSSAEPAFTR